MGNLVAARLFVLVRSDKRAKFLFSLGDSFTSNFEALLGSFVLLTLEGVDLNFKLKPAALELVDSFRRRLAGDANTRTNKLVDATQTM